MLPFLLFQEVWKAVSRINSAQDSDLCNNHDSGVPNLDNFTKTGCLQILKESNYFKWRRESDFDQIIFFKKRQKIVKLAPSKEI